MYKKIIFFSLILVFIFSFSGCSCSNKKKSKVPKTPVTLTYWRPAYEADKFKPLIDEYRTKHKNLTIKYELKDPATYEEDLLNALAAGTGPDIFAIKDEWILKHLDKISPVPDDIYKVDQYQKLYSPTVAQTMIQGGKIYGFPLSMQILGLFINQKLVNDYNDATNQQMRGKPYEERKAQLIQKTPETWNDFIDQVKRLTKKNGTDIQQAGVAMGTVKNIPNAVDILSLLMLQNNTTVYSDDGKSATFNLPVQKSSGETVYPGTVALDLYTSFARPNKETYGWNDSLPNALDAFIQGKVAMIFAYHDIWAEINRQNPTMKVQVAAVPQIKGSVKKMTFGTFWAETVSKNSPNKDTAWDFLSFLIEKNKNATFLKAISGVPARSDVPNRVSTAGVFVQQLPYTTNWLKTTKPEDVNKIFSGMINNVLAGMPSQTAIDKASSDVTKILQQQAKETGTSPKK